MGRRLLVDRLRMRPTGPSVSRRGMLGGLGGLAAVGCATEGKSPVSGDTGVPTPPEGTCGPGSPTAAGDVLSAGASPFEENPFQLGVASGDPLHDRVILWTRLVVEPTDVASSPSASADVIWQLFADEALTVMVQEGMVVATAESAHSVHVDVDGLDSATEYWYRFICGAHESPSGRTRTLPCEDATVEVARIGFATCQNWQSGFYASHRNMAEARLDLVVFLGDYIYEAGTTGEVRDHGAPECFDLEAYRNRHGLYRSDADLQAAHQSAPWMPIWDDHEFDNNSVGGSTDDADVAARRTAAYQAWYEHMPVRRGPVADGSLQIYRAVDFGTLARFVLLDGRQHRDLQPCGDDIGATCDEVFEERTFLGAEQEAWVRTVFETSSEQWMVVANPVVMLPIDLAGSFLNPDQWDGYPSARARFMDTVATHAPGRTVLFSGDIHAAGVGVVPEDPAVYDGPAAIAEVVVPAVSSRFENELAISVGAILAVQAHIGWWDWSVNGWTQATISADAIDVAFWLVDDRTDPVSPVTPARTWRIEAESIVPVET
ncbi:MAG: alkaline phosphatase [Deltaproteobacteria bacterium]|nr:alkaline phosphatase [Deltaproteobacteria bacterium]